MKFDTVTNSDNDFKLRLKNFIDTELNSVSTFRYFQSRNINTVSAHLISCIFFDERSNIAYGHLDFDNDTVWLGIFVSKKFNGLGFGSKMMEYLLNYASNNKIKSINLSVDSDNLIAYNLYKKYGFKDYKIIDSKIFMSMKLYEK